MILLGNGVITLDFLDAWYHANIRHIPPSPAPKREGKCSTLLNTPCNTCSSEKQGNHALSPRQKARRNTLMMHTVPPVTPITHKYKSSRVAPVRWDRDKVHEVFWLFAFGSMEMMRGVERFGTYAKDFGCYGDKIQ